MENNLKIKIDFNKNHAKIGENKNFWDSLFDQITILIFLCSVLQIGLYFGPSSSERCSKQDLLGQILKLPKRGQLKYTFC